MILSEQLDLERSGWGNKTPSALVLLFSAFIKVLSILVLYWLTENGVAVLFMPKLSFSLH